MTASKKPTITTKKSSEGSNGLAIGIGAGMGIGAIAGLVIFDNVGAGIAIGLCFGVAIGTSLDARTSQSKAAAEPKTKKK